MVNTELPSTTSAINVMGGIGLEDATTHALFLAHHKAGDCAGGQYGGWVYQSGTKCLGDIGYNWDYMMHFYYDYSFTLSYHQVGYFSY